MIYFEVRTIDGRIILGNAINFPEYSEYSKQKKFKHDFGKGRVVRGEEMLKDGLSVWVIADSEIDLVNSSKLFKKVINTVAVIAAQVYENQDLTFKSYAHTLVNIHAQMKQKIDDVFPRDTFFSESYSNLLSKTQTEIQSNLEDAADLLCYLNKRTIDMGAQLLGAAVVLGDKDILIKLSEVNLRRAILSQATPFLDELNSRGVQLRFFFEEDAVSVDKRMFSLIMYNIFSNALKYVKPETEIRFNYVKSQFLLDVSMISLKMDRSELTGLHNLGKRGRHTEGIPGNGIGLYTISRALTLMGKAQMNILPKYESELSDGVYVENHFQFYL